MKKITFLLVISMISFHLNAQSVYFKPYGGYGFAVQGAWFNTQSYYYYENPDTNYSTNSYQEFKYSFGKGTRFGLNVGTNLTKNLAIEIGGCYSKSKLPEIVTYEIYTFDYDLDAEAKFTNRVNMESKSWQITPEVVIKSSNLKIIPYVKLGSVIAITSIKEFYKSNLTNTIPGYYPFEDWEETINYEKTVSVGFSAAFGCEFYLFDNVYFFTETKFSNLSCSPKKAKMTEYKYRGEDQLETLTTQARYVEYVDAYNDTENNDPDKPAKLLSCQFSLNNTSVIVGFKVNIDFKKRGNEKIEKE